jgi:hypothetical protein
VIGMTLVTLILVLIIQELKHETDVHFYKDEYSDSDLRYREFVEMKNDKEKTTR